ncbi:MAG: DUF6272 family protein [Thermoflexibacter sp.]|jgi:hypothetical protein|nr:DUF6272 family protein [Thermoflexibacter sp.]
MTEEFENAKKWVEENEICRVEGDMEDKGKIKSFFQNLENYLKEIGTELTIMRKIFSVTVEIALNIRSHGQQAEKMPNFQHKITASIFENECKILGENLVKSEAIEKIIEKIGNINLYAYSPIKLKDAYKKMISSGILGEGRAGIVFFSIMLKSNHKILYHFEPIDSEYSYFSMIVTVKENN